MPTPTQTTTTTDSALKVKTHIKAGEIILNEVQEFTKKWLPSN
jgi:hypothetical protein